MLTAELSAPTVPSIFASLARKKAVLALVTAFFGLLGYVYASQFTVPVYEAKASLIRNGKQPSVGAVESLVPSLAADVYALNTEVEILYSYALLARVVDGLALDQDPEFVAPRSIARMIKGSFGGEGQQTEIDSETAAQNATIELQRNLQVRNIPSSLIFEVALVTQSPEKSQRIVNYLADLYVQDQLDAKFESTRLSTTWLTDRVADLERELQNAERAVTTFAAANDPIDRETLDTFTSDLLAIRARIGGLTGENSSNRLGRLDAATSREDQLAAVIELGGDRQLEQLALRLGGVTGGPIARAFDTRFRQIIDEARGGQGPDIAQLEILRRSEAVLVNLIEDHTQTLLALEQLERVATSSRLTYELFLGRLKESHIQQGIQQPDSRVLSYAVMPLTPKAPHIPSIVLLCTLLGFITAACLIVLRSSDADHFKSTKQLEDITSLKIATELPFPRASRFKRPSRSPKTTGSSAYTEGIRALQVALDLAPKTNSCQIITVTSSLPSEGKTTLAVALASGLGRAGNSVILIDDDLRKKNPLKGIKGQLGRKKQGPVSGLSEVLSGNCDLWNAIHRDEDAGLDYVVAGKLHKQQHVTWARQDLEQLVEYLSSRYQYIVFDTPPLDLFSDAFLPMSLSDMIYFNVPIGTASKSTTLKNIGKIREHHDTRCEIIALSDDLKTETSYKDYV